MVIYEAIDKEEAILTPEAEGVAAKSSPEAKVFEAVRSAMEGVKIADLPVRWLSCMPARLDRSNHNDADWLNRKLLAKRMPP